MNGRKLFCCYDSFIICVEEARRSGGCRCASERKGVEVARVNT